MIVLLPGLDGTGTLFEPLIACFLKPCAVKVIQYPADTSLSYEELETYVFNLLPIDSPYTVIAESFSGPIALRLSERGGQNLRAVVLVCSFAFRPLGWLGLLVARLPLGFILRFPIPDVIIRGFLLGEAAPEELICRARAVISSVNPKVLATRLRQALTSDYCAGQIQCTARVVALFSKADRLLGPTALTSISKACSTAELLEINAPHFALQSVPGEIIQSLVDLGVLDDRDPCH
jgi:pimeloyl-[acyl-carrier protein] methyl ester esterase